MLALKTVVIQKIQCEVLSISSILVGIISVPRWKLNSTKLFCFKAAYSALWCYTESAHQHP